MQFFASAVTTLQTLVVALGAGLAVWGVVNLLEGYGSDNAEMCIRDRDGMTHDYTRKGGVVHTEIMLPSHAPPSFSDRSTLWNSVELYEKAGNAQLAREIDAALPIELSREEQIRLVREDVYKRQAGGAVLRCWPASGGVSQK